MHNAEIMCAGKQQQQQQHSMTMMSTRTCSPICFFKYSFRLQNDRKPNSCFIFIMRTTPLWKFGPMIATARRLRRTSLLSFSVVVAAAVAVFWCDAGNVVGLLVRWMFYLFSVCTTKENKPIDRATTNWTFHRRWNNFAWINFVGL